MQINALKTALAGAVLALGMTLPQPARAHCDTLDGPVVRDARTALAKRDVTPVLKWLREADVETVRAVFAQTLVVRTKGPEAQELADRYFFETLVRLHRGGEGAPFTGLKPAGTNPGPAVRGADEALEHGSVDALAKQVADEMAAGIRRRFALAQEHRRRAEDSVAAGRDYVAAYVEYVHYVEGLHQAAAGAAGTHREESEAAPLRPAEAPHHNH